MKIQRVVHVVVIVAVGLLGLAPAVVCAMPQDCPMIHPQAAVHGCCLPAADGMTAAPCYATQPAATPAQPTTPFHGAAPLSIAATAVVDAPLILVGFHPAATPVAAVPRFLLTHTFRL